MYSILIADEALEEIARLDKKTAGRVMMEISWLAENAGEITPRGLRGSLSAFAKLRVGDYRLIYELNHTEEKLNVHYFGHRRDVYKGT